MEESKEYKVLVEGDFEGVKHVVGDVMVLTEELAKPLVEAGRVELVVKA